MANPLCSSAALYAPRRDNRPAWMTQADKNDNFPSLAPRKDEYRGDIGQESSRGDRDERSGDRYQDRRLPATENPHDYDRNHRNRINEQLPREAYGNQPPPSYRSGNAGAGSYLESRARERASRPAPFIFAPSPSRSRSASRTRERNGRRRSRSADAKKRRRRSRSNSSEFSVDSRRSRSGSRSPSRHRSGKHKHSGNGRSREHGRHSRRSRSHSRSRRKHRHSRRERSPDGGVRATHRHREEEEEEAVGSPGGNKQRQERAFPPAVPSPSSALPSLFPVARAVATNEEDDEVARYKRDVLGLGAGAGATSTATAGLPGGAEAADDGDSDYGIGPRPPTEGEAGEAEEEEGGGMRLLSGTGYGAWLGQGEGEKIAAYMQAGQRVPRRGEVSWSGDQIEHLESVGYVMSGNRHKRMTEVRLRKEAQVQTAEEKKALALYKYEQQSTREEKLRAEFRALVEARMAEGAAAAGTETRAEHE